MKRQPLRLALVEAERMLADAGVPSPRVDAELLAAYVLGVDRGKLLLVAPLVDPSAIESLRRVVEQRVKRIPLQHIVGHAAFGPVELAVEPGVFIPRPETELLLEWGLDALAEVRAPVVVDLCTGTGALALAVAASRPDAQVHAVEVDPTALALARRNIDARLGTGAAPVRLYSGDVRHADLLPDLESRVDLVLCNPPYIPDGTPLPPEVARHDPPGALFAGPDGLSVIREVIALSAGLLRHGGALAIEHDDTHGEAVPALLRKRRVLVDVADHLDLAGRPRFATARRRQLQGG